MHMYVMVEQLAIYHKSNRLPIDLAGFLVLLWKFESKKSVKDFLLKKIAQRSAHWKTRLKVARLFNSRRLW